MKHAKKMQLVPYINEIDNNNNKEISITKTNNEHFDTILNMSNLNDEEKIKLYLNSFAKYRDKYHASKIEKEDIKILKELIKKFENFMEQHDHINKNIKVEEKEEEIEKKIDFSNYNKDYNIDFLNHTNQDYSYYDNQHSILNQNTTPQNNNINESIYKPNSEPYVSNKRHLPLKDLNLSRLIDKTFLDIPRTPKQSKPKKKNKNNKVD
jgi:hypothetical protein